MGFAKEANRRAAAKGRELELIASMHYTGRVYRVDDDIIDAYLVSVGSHAIQEAERRDFDIEEITSVSELDSELDYFTYEEEVDEATDIIDKSRFDK